MMDNYLQYYEDMLRIWQPNNDYSKKQVLV